MHPETSSAKPASPDVGAIFDLAPLALLILSPAWRITRASARFLSDWKVAAEDCIGQSLLPFLEQQLRPPRPTHLAHVTAAIDDAIANRAERTTNPINTSHAVSWRARIVPVFSDHELLSILLEWHEGPSSAAEDDLVKPGFSTDEAFRILVQGVKDYAIFLLDTKGYIATWNQGAQLLKGYKRDEIIGKHFSIFYGKEDLDIKKPEMELEICMREGRVEDEGWRYRQDGSRFWANVVITAVYKNGVHVGFGKVTRDLTERKSAESRLIAAYEESEKLKSDFLANMSHEIRTPMHGMLSACTLLLDTPLTARQRDIVSIMDESGEVLLQVINDILDYSKLASGSFSIHSDIVGITSIVTSVVRGVQTTLPPSVHFELFLAPDLPKSVQGDPLRYRQILQNIVGNAAKFTDKGSIRVQASVQSEDEASYTILTEVTDTGIGVPDEAAASLFTPFMQFDTTTTKQYKGTGLGLSIAKSLTELMGGRIGYRPNPERHGSVFWFTAQFKKIKSLEKMHGWKKPITVSERSTTHISDPDVEELQRELRMVASTKNLLVVEDNLINQKVMLGMLRSIGFKNVGLASNGVEAVRMVRGKPAAYDAVLMDINMPIMDGHAAAKDIRAAGIYVPIVAMTAYALKGDKERCLENGMNDYIAKPVDKKRLIKVLGKWLLRMTDYRKNFEERLALARRHAEVGVLAATPAVTPTEEPTYFPVENANGVATPQQASHDAPVPPPRATVEKPSTSSDDKAQVVASEPVNHVSAATGTSDPSAKVERSSNIAPTTAAVDDPSQEGIDSAKQIQQPWDGVKRAEMQRCSLGDITNQQHNAAGEVEESLPNVKSAEAKSAETKPAETKPAETKPAETSPAETSPAETSPAETSPAETSPAETKPAETNPAETNPAETNPAKTKPAETKLVETESAETKPVETQQSQSADTSIQLLLDSSGESKPDVPTTGPPNSLLVSLLIYNGWPFADHWEYFIAAPHTPGGPSGDKDDVVGVVIQAAGDVRAGFWLEVKRGWSLGLELGDRDGRGSRRNCQTWVIESAEQLVREEIFEQKVVDYLRATSIMVPKGTTD
ncbi:hypothetical protein NEMBOFW57_006334 [Staphylotrichum longicolle]|uniref:histidine kinase n=1 Tax=Staphylotrichum longicolle TaxID=669026 RepID=A0AAD4EYU9_9PEZI|nr:hypothetical protein NEMBOFW57_006334 [Staphylotrichum longicolle]